MRAVPTSLVFILVVLTSGAALEAQVLDRIYVDQYMPPRSEPMIADADGSNPRKLVPGMEIDCNASFSYDGQWVVFTSYGWTAATWGACGHLGAGQCRVPELVARRDGDRVPLLDRDRAGRGAAHRRGRHRQVPRPDHRIRHPAILVAPGRRDHVHPLRPDDRFRYDEFDIYTIRPDGART